MDITTPYPFKALTRKGGLVRRALGLRVRPVFAFSEAAAPNEIPIVDDCQLMLVCDTTTGAFRILTSGSPLEVTQKIVADKIIVQHVTADCYISVCVLNLIPDFGVSGSSNELFAQIAPVAITEQKTRARGLQLHAHVNGEYVCFHDGSNALGTTFTLPYTPNGQRYTLTDGRPVEIDDDRELDEHFGATLAVRLARLQSGDTIIATEDDILDALTRMPMDLFNSVKVFVLQNDNLSLMSDVPTLVDLVTESYPNLSDFASQIFRLMQEDVNALRGLMRYLPRQTTPDSQQLARHVVLQNYTHGSKVFHYTFLEFLLKHLRITEPLFATVPAIHTLDLAQLSKWTIEAFFLDDITANENVLQWMTQLEPQLVGPVATIIVGILCDITDNVVDYIEFIPLLGRFFGREASFTTMIRLRAVITRFLKRFASLAERLSTLTDFVEELDNLDFFVESHDALLDAVLQASSPVEALFALPTLIQLVRTHCADATVLTELVGPILRKPGTTDEYNAEMATLMMGDFQPPTEERSPSRASAQSSDDDDSDYSDDDDFVPVLNQE